MNYNELKSIAQPHLRESDDLPSNAFLLLNQLHIPFKSKAQCEAEYSGKMTPLYNTPAYLEVDTNGNKTVYFNDSTKYWNFYIFHEIAHYLLGHEDDNPQHEMDADLLACILAAPIENLPSNIKTARDLSTLSKIPIDKAEVYWSEIKENFSTGETKKNPWMFTSFACIGALVLSLIFSILKPFDSNATNTPISNESPVIHISQYQGTTPIIEQSPKVVSDDVSVDVNSDELYVTASGTKYHIKGCQYIKDKTNLISITIEEAEKLSISPCKRCIK